MKHEYRVGEFASLTGVTVRTLHHYDRIGLLKPSGRTESGYRLYGEADLLRLQQVLTLRHLGFKLGEISELLQRPDFDLVASMRIQRASLNEQIERLKKIETAIGDMLDSHARFGTWDWELALAASSAVQNEFNQKEKVMGTNFTPEQMEQAKRLRESLPDGYIEDVQDRWTALISEIKANLEIDPSSEHAKSLAKRWDELTAETMKAWEGAPGLTEKIQEGYKTGAFADNPHAPTPEVFGFIEKVKNSG